MILAATMSVPGVTGLGSAESDCVDAASTSVPAVVGVYVTVTVTGTFVTDAMLTVATRPMTETVPAELTRLVTPAGRSSLTTVLRESTGPAFVIVTVAVCAVSTAPPAAAIATLRSARSEERRVGKECRL